MLIPKVYLAKSNKANPDLVSKVRQNLSQFEVEIVEFTGGTYTHKPLLSCELLIVVPDLTNNDIIIGKGLFEQINEFINYKDDENILIVTNFKNETIFVDMVDDMYVDDGNDYVNYGVLSVSGSEDKISDVLKLTYGYKKKTMKESDMTSIKNNYQYLLIKR